MKKNMKILYTIAVLLSTPLLSFAALADSNPAKDLLTRASFFIKDILIPILFGIAFLFFLVNMVKYFIIGATNEDSRAKAKRNVLYTLAAFVFLISIWSIISLILDGLDIDGNNKSLCPDYVTEQGKSCDNIEGKAIDGASYGSVTFPGSSNNTRNGSGARSSFTDNTRTNTINRTRTPDTGIYRNSKRPATAGGSSDTDTQTDTLPERGLSELIFGIGKDSMTSVTHAGAPRAASITPSIPPQASCTQGMHILQQSSRDDMTQTVYALYKATDGSAQWKNLTDTNTLTSVGIDQDVLHALIQSDATNIQIIHTHPRAQTKNMDLVMDGRGPSQADFVTMCNPSIPPNLSYAVVDWKGVWKYESQNDTCPYITNAQNVLPLIETYENLASLDSVLRQNELFDYLNSPITPVQYKNHFSTIDTAVFPSLSAEDMHALSEFYQTYASTTVQYQTSVDNYCANF